MINGAWVFNQSENGVKKRGVSAMDGVQKEQDDMDAPCDIVNSSIVNVQAEKVSILIPCETSFNALLVGVENYGLSADPMDDIDDEELVRVVI
ncbi:unnamed protein product [Cochlearia groenlandica]